MPAGKHPPPGAVLVALNSSGAVLARNISDGRGQYRVALAENMRRLRVLRIGFRPRDVRIPDAVDGVARRVHGLAAHAPRTRAQPTELIQQLPGKLTIVNVPLPFP